ncbi:haloacid dehalogenase superfamily, subfamily IA, variant 3 with third motif having DD or ED/haloacid dehalogenase superfamily, subfamily IA, variant 1 with third motif having Dx(3-4)D or Dx(3-4)E [Arthrobacter sp. ov407]|uniref:D-glycero-alpha-D-manno-heptose-1,7-bisphosphate 7-phosphatase n=1 Tax=Arthrobacter sp. ov407 TaxID=1761748 RepID=UPI00089076F7|nr:HAD family hydrolase [Arthrobacter sp. ov407]SDL83406.1 haloacid dehalogenase superfamily, subfamily IA, variant 3 with third motif having DD or ED/haloacid dehalogenase superfamily, subfamily IA, variant 1 with third motif having Dx(3-4)D or Dx(3-4)E [Arthrobacter sp. ov407]
MGSSGTPQPRAVLFDRDGTLIYDVPYNADPARVRPMPHSRESLQRLRSRGIPIGVLSNQSGIGRGILTAAEVDAVNGRIDQLLGPFDLWVICPHIPADRCPCRKPAPGMVLKACRSLGVSPAETALIGDIGSDMEAARASGARGILVPTPVTRAAEVEAAVEVAADLAAAVDLLLKAAAGKSEP